MKKWFSLVLIALTTIGLSFVVFSVPAYAGKTSLGLKASTLGAGVEIERSFSEKLGGRVGLNFFSYSYDGVEEDIDYDFDLELLSGALLLDWHPFSGSFRLTGGAIFNGNNLDATGQSSDTYDIGGSTYTGAELGTLNGDIDFDAVVPYAGIGWNTSFGETKSGWGFIADIGVVFQGKPDVSLSADGPVSQLQSFQDDLAVEEKDLQDSLDEFEFYPVIAIGVTYSF